MSRTAPKPTTTGRRPAGLAGDKSSEYPMLAVRLPPATKATLKALALQHRAPLWKVVDEAVAAYVATLPADERKLLAQLARRAQ